MLPLLSKVAGVFFISKRFCEYNIFTKGGIMAKIKVVKPKSKKQPNNRKPNGKVRAKCVASILVILSVVSIFVFVAPKLGKQDQQSPPVYQGVVNLWIVDSFEGGSGSRATWFTQRSATFEKQNKGLFVCVTTMNEQQFLHKLSQTTTENSAMESFDMVCFSRGVGAHLKHLVAPLDVDVGNLLDNFALSGQIKNTTFAIPVFCGAYCLFARASQLKGDLLSNCLTNTFTRKIGKNTFDLQPLICGFTTSNSPLTALAMAGAKGVVSPDYNVSQYSAYEKFLANKTAVTLLGTQRDIFRLGQKVEMGKMEGLAFAPLCAYTDLVEYVAINKNTSKFDACLNYVKYLVSNQVQQQLTKISMFGVTHLDLYTQHWYVDCQQGLKTAYVPNVFGDQNVTLDQRQKAIATLQTGEK